MLVMRRRTRVRPTLVSSELRLRAELKLRAEQRGDFSRGVNQPVQIDNEERSGVEAIGRLIRGEVEKADSGRGG
jgi:hypothetical protein